MRHPQEKGNGFLRFVYARWRQILALLDCLGADGKPSQSKMAAYAVLIVGLWRCSEILAIAGLAACFGRAMLSLFLNAWRGTSATVKQDLIVRQERDPSTGIDPA